MLKNIFKVGFLLMPILGNAQLKAPDNWFNLDYSENKVRGVSTEKAYDFLKGKTSRTIIVAVIDGGVDINHEDLKGKIWVNEKEIAGNGLDDDKNGFIDDVNGWNFIGGKDGKNVGPDNFELTREMNRISKKFEGLNAEKIKNLKGKDKEEYESLAKIKGEFEKKKTEYEGNLSNIKQFHEMYKSSALVLKGYLKKDSITKAMVDTISSNDALVSTSKRLMLYAYEINFSEPDIAEYEKSISERLEFGLNPNFDTRKIVGDHYNDLKEKGYGNTDVKGPDASHGTHVAGIIAANRKNGIGMDGVCENVKIMAIRCVPNGDERDKDVANAIRYAVDNGAMIINMSFGKDFSPNREYVEEAIKYATSKNVLLVHAAGNDHKNVDLENNFPNNKRVKSKSWIEIGASAWGDTSNFVANFSNYGKKTVDLFAPGLDIYSTMPGNKYKNQSGTSMASPVTAGVAALIWSYFPNLNAVQLKDVLMKSTIKYPNLKVNKPTEEKSDEKISFGELSVSGGIVNALEAAKLASKISVK